MSLFNNQNIELTLSKDDAVILLKSLKIAKARKKLEANHHLRKNEIEHSNRKFDYVQKIGQLEHYLQYLIK